MKTIMFPEITYTRTCVHVHYTKLLYSCNRLTICTLHVRGVRGVQIKVVGFQIYFDLTPPRIH